jgi:hypothetical protein
VEKPLLQRSFARAKIESLLERQAKEGQDARIAQEIIGLSTSHRVLSPYTSLLVLETEADYKRFKIDRRALSDILTVEDGRLAVLKRSEIKEIKHKPVAKKEAEAMTAQLSAAMQEADPPVTRSRAERQTTPADAGGNLWGDSIGDAFGAGGLGLSGIGEGGGGEPGRLGSAAPSRASGGAATGSGRGRTAGAHRTRPPQIRMGATSVSGRLPPEVIQWIVRRNFNRFRNCYEGGLRTNPKLAGRVAVKFTIERSGEIADVSVASADLPDPAVVACVKRTFASLSFPQPEGGFIVVIYPLISARRPTRGSGGGAPARGDPGEPRGHQSTARAAARAAAARGAAPVHAVPRRIQGGHGPDRGREPQGSPGSSPRLARPGSG